MLVLDKIFKIISLTMSILVAYKTVWLIIGLFCKPKKYADTDKRFKYAVVICARNEEKVIAQIIDSIHKQDYDQDKISIFVMAHNCTDNTAQIARDNGAIVYEWNAPDKRRKGYALEYLFEQIKKDYGYEAFDSYLFLDADNLLKQDYISQINKAFGAGEKVVGTYRNTKNFDTNSISAAYGFHFYRQSMFSNRPRSLMGLGTSVAGTGFAMHNSILVKNDGWHFLGLTEDNEFSLQMAIDGVKIAYCEDAEFYDEQPTNMKTAWTQRLRWTKGILVSFFAHMGGLFKTMFGKGKTFQQRVTAYDLFFHFFPYYPFGLFVGLFWPIITGVVGVFRPDLFVAGRQFMSILTWAGGFYFSLLAFGILLYIRERKHIVCKPKHIVKYLFTWAWFDLINFPLFVVAVSRKIEWKQIDHNIAKTIDEMNEEYKDPSKTNTDNANVVASDTTAVNETTLTQSEVMPNAIETQQPQVSYDDEIATLPLLNEEYPVNVDHANENKVGETIKENSNIDDIEMLEVSEEEILNTEQSKEEVLEQKSELMEKLKENIKHKKDKSDIA